MLSAFCSTRWFLVWENPMSFFFGPSSQEGQAQARMDAQEASQASNNSATRGNENDQSYRESPPEKHGWDAVDEKHGTNYGGNNGK